MGGISVGIIAGIIIAIFCLWFDLRDGCADWPFEPNSLICVTEDNPND